MSRFPTILCGPNKWMTLMSGLKVNPLTAFNKIQLMPCSDLLAFKQDIQGGPHNKPQKSFKI